MLSKHSDWFQSSEQTPLQVLSMNGYTRKKSITVPFVIKGDTAAGNVRPLSFTRPSKGRTFGCLATDHTRN